MEWNEMERDREGGRVGACMQYIPVVHVHHQLGFGFCGGDFFRRGGLRPGAAAEHEGHCGGGLLLE